MQIATSFEEMVSETSWKEIYCCCQILQTVDFCTFYKRNLRCVKIYRIYEIYKNIWDKLI